MHAHHSTSRIAVVACCLTWSCSSHPTESPSDAATSRPHHAPPSVPSIGWSPEKRRQPPPVVIAAQHRGIALVDALGADIASAATDFLVVDIDYDPVVDRLLVAERDDDSANQLSLWQVTSDNGQTHLTRIVTRSTEGHGRVFATPSGALLIEHDGLQAHWSLLSTDLATVLWRARGPVPSTLFSQDAESVRRTGIVQLDTVSGPVVTAHDWDVEPDQLAPVRSATMPEGWTSLSPIRACSLGADAAVVARIDGQRLLVDVFADGMSSLLAPSAQTAASAAAVADIACDAQRGEAYLLLAEPEHATLARATPGHVQLLDPALSSVLDRGGWPTRRLALDVSAGRLFAASENAVSAIDVHAVEPTLVWQRDDLRWPVRVASLGTSR